MEDKEKNATERHEDEYEKVCCVCRRPESKAGKMVTMPGGLDVCRDCMQKAFDMVTRNGFDLSKLSPEQLWNAQMGILNPGKNITPQTKDGENA